MAEQGKIRIQKALSDCGYTSRRNAEELIREGRIKINGRKAEIGAAVNPNRNILTRNKGKKSHRTDKADRDNRGNNIPYKQINSADQ